MYTRRFESVTSFCVYAGATEVKFLYDERDNSDVMTCLIDEGMRECHGPALWVSTFISAYVRYMCYMYMCRLAWY